MTASKLKRKLRSFFIIKKEQSKRGGQVDVRMAKAYSDNR